MEAHGWHGGGIKEMFGRGGCFPGVRIHELGVGIKAQAIEERHRMIEGGVTEILTPFGVAAHGSGVCTMFAGEECALDPPRGSITARAADSLRVYTSCAEKATRRLHRR